MGPLRIGSTKIEPPSSPLDRWSVTSLETPVKFRTSFWDAVAVAVLEEIPEDWPAEIEGAILSEARVAGTHASAEAAERLHELEAEEERASGRM